MKLVRWEFNNLHVPMMEDDQGNLFCTTKQLASALNCPEDTIRRIRRRHEDELADVSKTFCLAKEFLESHKAEFAIGRMRKDLTVWTEDDMILVAILSKSQVGKEFRRNLVSFIKANARKDYVQASVHERLREEHAKLRADVDSIMSYLDMTASTSGKLLNAQKQTKHLRLVN